MATLEFLRLLKLGLSSDGGAAAAAGATIAPSLGGGGGILLEMPEEEEDLVFMFSIWQLMVTAPPLFLTQTPPDTPLAVVLLAFKTSDGGFTP